MYSETRGRVRRLGVVAGGQPPQHVRFPAGQAVNPGEQVGPLPWSALLDGHGDVLRLGPVVIVDARRAQGQPASTTDVDAGPRGRVVALPQRRGAGQRRCRPPRAPESGPRRAVRAAAGTLSVSAVWARTCQIRVEEQDDRAAGVRGSVDRLGERRGQAAADRGGDGRGQLGQVVDVGRSEAPPALVSPEVQEAPDPELVAEDHRGDVDHTEPGLDLTPYRAAAGITGVGEQGDRAGHVRPPVHGGLVLRADQRRQLRQTGTSANGAQPTPVSGSVSVHTYQVNGTARRISASRSSLSARGSSA